jgi:hypothetical protein
MALGLGNILTKGGALLGFPNKYSFNFDGSNDYLEIADNDGCLDLTNFTLSAWIRLTDVSDFRGIISKRSSTDVNYSFFVTITGANDGKLGSYDGSAEINSSATVNDGNWHHVAQVHNSGTTTFYIDGSASGSGSQSFSTNAHAVLIGEAGVGQNDKFLGNIDEVAIWDTALDATAIGKISSKVVDLTKYSASNLKLWLRAGDKVLPESDASIARSDFYTAFDGINDYIAGVGQSFTGAFSIGMCLKPNNVTDSGIGVLGTTTVLVAGKWIYLAITRDSSNVLKWFVNGAYIGSSATQSGTFTFNNFARSVSTYFDGSISNVSLYQTALDAQTMILMVGMIQFKLLHMIL